VKWQEYQEAVGVLYEQFEKMGTVQKDIYRPDKVTKQKRQIDIWCEIMFDTHQINVLIDAKLRSVPIDVKVVEEVAALAEAVTANKAIIVTNKGFTKPAMQKAKSIGMDIRILSIEEALNFVVPNKWMMCYDCKDECVVMEWDGVLFRDSEGLFFDWSAGRCRECKNLYLYCPGCGSRTIIEDSDPWRCNCKHTWKTQNSQLLIKFKGNKKFIRIDNAIKATPEFLSWLMGYDIKYWAHALAGRVITLGTESEETFSFLVTANRDIIPVY
jgi:hypothetical protein